MMDCFFKFKDAEVVAVEAALAEVLAVVAVVGGLVEEQWSSVLHSKNE
jgi:hypothetical protein